MPIPPNSNNYPITGIAMIVGGLFLFSLQDVIIKFFSDRYSVLQIVFVRGMVAILFISVALALTMGLRGFFARKPRLLFVKGLCGFCSYTAYYLAIAALPLADVVAIVFTAPIIVTVMAAMLLKEQVGVRRWAAVIVGFAGVVIVVGPGGHIGDLGAILAMLAAITYAASTLITRYIGPDDRPWTITLYSMVVFVVGAWVASVLAALISVFVQTDNPSLQFLLRPWVVPQTGDLLLMMFLGVNATAGFYFLVRAYWIAPASTIAPFEYTYMVWAVLFGYLIWAEIPQVTTIAGVALLIGSSLYIMHRELGSARRAARRPPSPQITSSEITSNHGTHAAGQAA